jgi:single-strand DNA-binding protein
MAASNINRVILTANLTRDPELRSTGGGTSVCSLRVASNTRRKNGQTGEWEDKPNFFDVTVWGKQAENCARFLTKGRACAIDGRLEWREFTDKQGNKRQAVEIVADSVQFIGGPQDGGGQSQQSFEPRSDIPSDTSDFQPAGGGSSYGTFGGGGGSNDTDDIPF